MTSKDGPKGRSVPTTMCKERMGEVNKEPTPPYAPPCAPRAVQEIRAVDLVEVRQQDDRVLITIVLKCGELVAITAIAHAAGMPSLQKVRLFVAEDKENR